jgi:hypothetical protein
MDPLAALAELDKLVAEVSLNRAGTLHFMRCTAVIRESLQRPPCFPTAQPQADGSPE